MPMTLQEIERITVLLMPMEDMANLPYPIDHVDDVAAFEERDAQEYFVKKVAEWMNHNLCGRELYTLRERLGLNGGEGKSFQEIANDLGVSKSSAQLYYKNALKRIQQWLSKEKSLVAAL